MGSMAVGFTAAYTSPALASIDAAANASLEALDDLNSTANSSFSTPLTVTEEQKSWIGSLMPLSALVGSIIGGYLIDALGRKMVILICGPPFIVGERSLANTHMISFLFFR